MISEHFRAILSRLGRITSSTSFIPEIDGLRFVAITAVIFYHVNGYVSQHTGLGKESVIDPLAIICSKGNFGVSLFFAISGFILSLPFARHYLIDDKAVNLKRYYLRRLTRIEPPYLIALIVHLVLLLSYKHEDLGKLLPHLAASIFYLHNLIYEAPSTICSVAWSLEIEVQFYLLAPFLTRVFAINNQVVRRSLLILGIVIFSVLVYLLTPTLSLLHFFQYFLVGFLLADIYILDWSDKSRKPLAWNFAGFLAWGILIYALVSETSIALITPWCVLIAFMAAFRGSFGQSIFRQPMLTTIGGMCYTIYLYHMLLMSMFGRYTTQLVWTDQYWALLISQLVILFPIIIMISSIIFVITEQPFMRRDILLNLHNRLKPKDYD